MNGDKRCHTMKKKDKKDTLNRVCLIPFFLSKRYSSFSETVMPWKPEGCSEGKDL